MKQLSGFQTLSVCTFRVIPQLLVLIFLVCLPVMASDQSQDVCQPYTPEPCERNGTVDDVTSAFDSLTHHGEWMGFRSGDGAPIRLSGAEHIQGIARSWRHGTPYLFVSSAGDSDANLMVVEMGSRDEWGERLRSNRLHRDVETDCTLPPDEDRVVENHTIDDYNHPGDLAMVGDILVVPFEQPVSSGPKGLIRFFNTISSLEEKMFDLVPVGVENESGTVRLTRLAQIPDNDETSIMDKGFGVVGIARLPDKHFLLVTGAGTGSKVEFWRSNIPSFFVQVEQPDGTFVLEPDETFAFELHSTLYKDHKAAAGTPVPDSPGMEDWFVSDAVGIKPAFHTYQGYSLVNQTNTNDRLFMIVSRNVFAGAPYQIGENRIALYEIRGFEKNGHIAVSNIRREADGVVTFDNDVIIPWCTGEPRGILKTSNANLLAGGGTYVSPSGELLFYAVEHYNWGPANYLSPDERTVRMVELRHRKVVRNNSPTYRPHADAGGTYFVYEGSSIELNGTGSRSTIAAPWAQLFEHRDFKGQSVMFDYADMDRDDYDDFSKLDNVAPVDLCYDGEELDQGRAAFMKVSEYYKDLQSFDFIMNGCLGTAIVNNKCYVSPPLTGDALEVCDGFCQGTYISCRAACFGGCSGSCGDARTGCKNTCRVSIKGKVIPILDMDGLGLAIVQDTINGGVPLAKGLLELTLELVDLVSSVRACNGFDRLAHLGDSPPLPDFSLLTSAYYGIKSGKDIFKITEIINGFPNFENNLKTALSKSKDSLDEIIAYIDKLTLSLQGFNNRTSSIRWYVPDGETISLFWKADHKGSYLPLYGTGKVEEFASLGNANDQARSVRFDSIFEPPAIVGYEWSIEYPMPSYPYDLFNYNEVISIFDATGGDGPLTAQVWLDVSDSVGATDQAEATVQVFNALPVVQIDRIDDERGIPVFDRMSGVPASGMPVLLEALKYDMYGSSTDAGILDTHDSLIDWGDGQSNTSDEDVFLFVEAENGEGGSVGVPHIYVTTGGFSLVLEVTDDDGGVGQAELMVEVVDAIWALEIQIEELSSFIDGLTNPDKRLLKALDKLLGKRGSEGALGKFEKGQACSALEHIKQALKFLEIAVERDPSLDLLEIREQLVLVAKCSVSKAILAAEATALKTSDWRKIQRAIEYVEEGDALRNIGDYTEAISNYRKALGGGEVCNNDFDE